MVDTDLESNQARARRAQGANPFLENYSPPWKNVLGIVQKLLDIV